MENYNLGSSSSQVTNLTLNLTADKQVFVLKLSNILLIIS